MAAPFSLGGTLPQKTIQKDPSGQPFGLGGAPSGKFVSGTATPAGHWEQGMEGSQNWVSDTPAGPSENSSLGNGWIKAGSTTTQEGGENSGLTVPDVNSGTRYGAAHNLNPGDLANLGFTGSTTSSTGGEGQLDNRVDSVSPEFQSWMHQNNTQLAGKPEELGVTSGLLDASGTPLTQTKETDTGNDFWTAALLAGGLVGGSVAGAGTLGGGAATTGSLTGEGAMDAYAAMDAGYGAAGVGGGAPVGSGALGLEGATYAGVGGEGSMGLANAGATATDTGIGSLTGEGAADSYAAMDAGYGGVTAPSTAPNLGGLATNAVASKAGSSMFDQAGQYLKDNPTLGKFAGAAAGTLGAGLASKALAGSPPAAVNADALVTQQSAANLAAAQQQAQINRVDTTTPFGFQKFGQVADPSVPGGIRYTQDIGLSPEQQKLYNAQTSNQIASQGIANSMQGRVAASVANPLDLSNAGKLQGAMSGDAFSADKDKVTKALYDRLTSLRKPQMDKDTSALDVKLRNQGLMPGTEAYNNGMKSLLDSQGSELSNAADQAVLAGGAEQTRLQTDARANAGLNNNVQQATIQQNLLQRQQPLAEYNSFQTGAAPTLPAFQPFGLSSVAPTNTTAAAQTAYGTAADRYNAKIANLQSLLNFGTTVAKP